MDNLTITLDGVTHVVQLDYETTATVVLNCDNGDGTFDSAQVYDYDVTHAK